jgi:Uncharacterized conserved protein
MSRDLILFLEDIINAIEKIQRYIGEYDIEKFRNDELVYDAVIRNLEIVGEATRSIPHEIRDKYPAISWRKVTAMRNVLVHVYHGIDDEIVWDIIQTQPIMPVGRSHQ